MSTPTHSAGRGVKAVGFIMITIGIFSFSAFAPLGAALLVIGFVVFVVGRLMD